jgi:hypothetical protein
MLPSLWPPLIRFQLPKTIGGPGFCSYEDTAVRLKHLAGATTDNIEVSVTSGALCLDLAAIAVTYFSTRAAERPDDG